ncbi:MAG: FAD-dependent oxidoreductase [Solirubrobacterales bacterium]|nr:FAD-dependent oxidoreductase [Solirubrobacterales bacterium]
MTAPRKRIAIVGAGVSGLVTAHLLHAQHDVTVFEAQDRAGGHAWTVDVDLPDGPLAVDIGFLVFNDRNYPHFEALLAELGVESRASDMSFSVSDGADFEYAGNGPRGLLANPKHLYDRKFLKMVAEYIRFNKDAKALMDGDEDPSLRDWLRDLGYSDYFVHRLIVPQASAVWSADPEQMWSFPARFLVQFFDNHGLLGFRDRPEWRTVVGGSRRYVEAIIARLGSERVRLGAEVTAVERDADGVTVTARGGEPERFDEVVLATHSDQALALLTEPTGLERERLGAIPYLPSELVLHTDTSLLPRRRAAWASWNAHYVEEPMGTPAVSYWLNNLQGHEIDRELIATLNLTDRIDPAKVIARFDVAHPTYTPDGIETQRRHAEISGVNRTHYAGAYWSWGFHEDGVKSGHRVAAAILTAEPDRAIA